MARALRPGMYHLRMDSVEKKSEMGRDVYVVKGTVTGGAGHPEDSLPHTPGEHIEWKLSRRAVENDDAATVLSTPPPLRQLRFAEVDTSKISCPSCGEKIDGADEDGMVYEGDRECFNCGRGFEVSDIVVRATVTWRDDGS